MINLKEANTASVLTELVNCYFKKDYKVLVVTNGKLSVNDYYRGLIYLANNSPLKDMIQKSVDRPSSIQIIFNNGSEINVITNKTTYVQKIHCLMVDYRVTLDDYDAFKNAYEHLLIPYPEPNQDQ